MDDSDDSPALASARTSHRAVSSKQAGDGADSEPAASGQKKNFWRELLTIVVAAAILTLLVKAFVVQVYRIPSA